MDRRETGKRGEDAAAQWLSARGHRILDRNWRGGRVELDIVSEDSSGIHFVEVKSRKAPLTADPAVNVNFMKMKNLQSAAQHWLHSHAGFAPLEVFFDVITVVFDSDTTYLNYYPQAFIPIHV